MTIPGRDRLRALVLRYFEVPGARLLGAMGLSPNAVTLLGFGVAAGAAVLVGAGFLLAGGIVFLAGSVLDLMDGAMARQSGRVTRFGGLLDSVMDRLGEAALFLGIAVYGVRAGLGEGRLLFLIVALLLALTASQTVSYLRARGEAAGIETKTGVMTRPERVVLLALGLILGLRALEVILVIVAAVSALTLLQRLYRIKREVREEPAEH